MPRSVVIADDHGLLVSGLVDHLESAGFEVVGTAHDGIDAISVIKATQPDAAVIDMSMPGASGTEVFLESKRWSQNTRFIVLTANQSASLFSELMQAGIGGIFLKTDSIDEIVQGLSKVLRGRTVLSPKAISIMSQSDETPGLTEREMQVLQSIARGLSNPAIAADLGISAKTVNTHRTNLMQKLSVHTSATLLMKAIKLGLISVDT